jgi:hypothetical protein
MTRPELEFQVIYSTFLEEWMETLLGRLDRTSSFLQIVLGVAVVTSEAPKLSGFLVAIVAAYQLIWQPGVKACDARVSHGLWLDLSTQMSKLSDQQLEDRVNEASKSDSKVLGSLKKPAHRAATVQLGRGHNLHCELSLWERVVTRIAGGTVH